MTDTRVADQDELAQRLRKVAEALRELQKRVKSSSLMQKDRSFLVTRQQLISSLDFGDRVTQLLYNIIIDHCLKAEARGPGSFFLTLEIITGSILDPFAKRVSPSVAELAKCSFHPTFQQLQDVVRDEISDSFLSDVLFQAVSLSGVEGRIFVEQSLNEITSVEKLNGFSFPVSVPTSFEGTKSNVRCVVVDGVVESVSEIHRILQHFSEAKEPLFFACRGMADDVVQTLKVNVARKTLEVIPAVVKYDFDGLNVLSDIATVCCTDVVSSMKGELISTIDPTILPAVQSVTCKGGIVTVVNDRGVRAASLQVARLMEKRNEVTLEQFQKIYDNRVKSLSSSSVRIKLACDRDVSAFSERLDVVLRLVRSSLRHGFFSGSRMRTSDWSPVQLADPVPFDTVASAFGYADSCVRMLRSAVTVIV